MRQGREPHALLLTGAPGCGKRALAHWLAARKLQQADDRVMPVFPSEPVDHADLHLVTQPEDKQSIGIDQIRSLVAEVNLTSYAGFGKVAIVEPADRMTASAANSLLKTLEEPPGDALLILIVDRMGTLPATISSRCRKIAVALPDSGAALSWLDQIQPGASWPAALHTAGGAPLAAIAALEHLDQDAALAKDLETLGAGKGSVVEVAARWAKLEAGDVLLWLARQVQQAILAQQSGHDRAPGLSLSNSVLQRMDSRNMFCYLDIINRLRRQPGGSFNAQLAFEGLLIDWAAGLRDCG